MTRNTHFLAQIVAALALACLQVSWLFPLLLGTIIIRNSLAVPALLFGLPLAWFICFVHSLLVLLPIVYGLGQAIWEEPTGRLFAFVGRLRRVLAEKSGSGGVPA